MFSKYIIFAVSVVIFISRTYAGKYNVSYGDMTTCREYDILSGGYSYPDFFHLSSLNNSKFNNDGLLHLKLYVIASMDAHILLSEGNVVKRDDRVYEIVLGGGGNTFSCIRSKLSRHQVIVNNSPNVLATLDPTPVEIVQTKDGTLLISIPNFAEPLMKYVDANPLNITHISFSSYGLTKAKWFYDCASDGFADEMEIEAKPLTNEERLTADVLSVSDEQFPPPSESQISFSFKVRSVEFDHQTSLLHTRLHFTMNWTDSRLAWDPKSYGDIKSLTQPMFKIWHPELSITEGALNTFEKFDPFYSVRLDSAGNVQMFAPNAELHSWCFAASKDWPNDITKCNLTLSVRDNDIKLAYDTKSPLASENINELSEWKINKVAVFYTADNSSLYLQLIEDGLFIQLTISRNSEFYQCAFLAPALVSEGLVLLSFFLEEHRRGGLNLIAFIVLSIGLMVLVLHAPKGVISHIVLLYDTLLRISTITYILHIGTIWLEVYPPKMKPPGFVISVIDCSALRYVLAMRQQNSSDYLASLEYPWREVSKMINRIAFIALLITFAFIF